MATQGDLAAKLGELTAQVAKIGNEQSFSPAISATPISDAPEGMLRGMTIPSGATYRVTTVPQGAQVIALAGGDFILGIAASMARGTYALGWQLSTGISGSKAFQVV